MSFQDYETAKRAWVDSHPDATPAEHEDAMRAIAARLGV